MTRPDGTWHNSYTSSASNTTLSWARIRRIHLPAPGGWWAVADALVHRLHVPRKFARPVCDRYEIAVGIPRRDLITMDYGGKAPWWLRR